MIFFGGLMVDDDGIIRQKNRLAAAQLPVTGLFRNI
jgi:hypothetical protein